MTPWRIELQLQGWKPCVLTVRRWGRRADSFVLYPTNTTTSRCGTVLHRWVTPQSHQTGKPRATSSGEHTAVRPVAYGRFCFWSLPYLDRQTLQCCVFSLPQKPVHDEWDQTLQYQSHSHQNKHWCHRSEKNVLRGMLARDLHRADQERYYAAAAVLVTVAFSLTLLAALPTRSRR